MAQPPQLIPYEEIYDLDTFQLEDLQTMIKSFTTDDSQWNKKAKKILDLIEVELKERQAIENFAFNIQIEDFIQQPIYQNNALQAILNDIKNRPSNYLDLQMQKPPLPKHDQLDEDKLQKQQSNKQQCEQSNQQVQQNSQKYQQQSQNQSDTLSTRSNHPQSKVQSKKPNQLQDFMKDVLKKTDVSNQQFIIGAAINHRYIPPPPKPQLNTVDKIKQEKLMRKKKKQKVRTESLGKVVEHLPAIGKQQTIIKTQPKLEQSNVHSQISDSKQNFELKQKSLDCNINNQENNEELNEKCNINSQIQSNNQVVIIQMDQDQLKDQIKEKLNLEDIIEHNIKNNFTSHEKHCSKINDTNLQQQQINNQIYQIENEKQQEFRDQIQNIVQKDIENTNNFPQQLQDQGIEYLEQQNEFIIINQQNRCNSSQQNEVDRQSVNFLQDQKQNKLLEEKEQINQKDHLIQNHQDYIISNELIEYQKDNYLIQNQQFQNTLKKEEEYQDNINDEDEIKEFTDQQQKQSHDSKHKDIENETKSQFKNNKNSELTNISKNQFISKQSTSQQSSRRQDIKNKPSSQSAINHKGNLLKQLTMETRRQNIDAADDFHEVESDHEQVNDHKQKTNKDLGIKQNGKVDQSKQKGVIEIKQKAILTDKEKMDEISNICKEMGLDEFKGKQQQTTTPTQIIKAITPSANNRPKNPQSKYIQKMLQCIDDSKLEDYSDIVPTFQHLFSGFFNNQPHNNHLDVMREIFSIFSQHIEKVDNVESLLGKY